MIGFSTALSALQANQVSLEVTGNNIANANTPGFHRQVVLLSTRDSVLFGEHWVGQGVQVNSVKRVYDELAEAALTRSYADQASVTRQLQIVKQLEAILAPGRGTLLDRIESFFNELERLTLYPDDLASRSVTLRVADELAAEIRGLDGRLQEIVVKLDQEIQATIESIRNKSQELIELNNKIRDAESRGSTPNDLLDQRSLVVNEMSQFIDIELITQHTVSDGVEYSQQTFLLADGQLSFGSQPVELVTTTLADGTLQVQSRTGTVPFQLSSGGLAGLLAARNDLVPTYLAALSEFSHTFVSTVDTIHATGLGFGGSFDVLNGHRGVQDVDALLATQELEKTLRAGSLFINVVDDQGKVSLHEVAIDPATQSLRDIATAISTIDHVQAVVDPQSGRITLMSDPGHEFNFTGALPSQVDIITFTGTTVPEVAGSYTGDVNQRIQFEFLDTGIVGQSPQLRLRVTDGNGQVMAIVDVGQQYEPQSELEIGNGLKVRLSSGSVNVGDAFGITAVATPDTAGFLTSFGLNTLFVGSNLSSLQVDPELLRNPDRFATSSTGERGDTANIRKMLAQREALVVGESQQTFEEFLTDVVSSVGVQTVALESSQESLQILETSLEAERDSLSGVDTNEEMVRLLQFQRAFQAAARFIVSIDETLEELFNIIR
jgi:flagellar hook-associated protein FlgK